MATIKQISELANVSMATVSRVLNKDDTIMVSLEVRNKIFDIAHELGYVPPKRRRMEAANGITIGIADWHIIRQEAQHVKLSDYVGIAGRFVKEPVAFKRMTYGEDIEVDGIIALGHFSKEEVLYLKKQSYQILFINSERQDYQYDRIIMDYDEGFIQMASYIVDELKCKHIGYIGAYYEQDGIVIGKTRHEAFIKILQEKSCYEEAYCMIGEFSKESGYEMAKRVLEQGRLPEALLLGSDQIAEGVLEAFEEAGKQVPEDTIAIIYKDIETLRSKYEAYHSIQMFPDFVWETAIKLLIERITGTRTETMTVILPSKFCLGKE